MGRTHMKITTNYKIQEENSKLHLWVIKGDFNKWEHCINRDSTTFSRKFTQIFQWGSFRIFTAFHVTWIKKYMRNAENVLTKTIIGIHTTI